MGTKAGAEKSRLKREEKARLRAETEALADAGAISPSEAGGALILEHQNSDVLTRDLSPELPLQGQALASAMLDAAAPEAARVMVETMRQRKSPALRYAAASKLIDATVLRDRKGQPGQPADGLTARMAQAYRLRLAAAQAVDAVPVAAPDRGEAVTPERAVHSQQPSDK